MHQQENGAASCHKSIHALDNNGSVLRTGNKRCCCPRQKTGARRDGSRRSQLPCPVHKLDKGHRCRVVGAVLRAEHARVATIALTIPLRQGREDLVDGFIPAEHRHGLPTGMQGALQGSCWNYSADHARACLPLLRTALTAITSTKHSHLLAQGDHLVCHPPQLLGLWERGFYPLVQHKL